MDQKIFFDRESGISCNRTLKKKIIIKINIKNK